MKEIFLTLGLIAHSDDVFDADKLFTEQQLSKSWLSKHLVERVSFESVMVEKELLDIAVELFLSLTSRRYLIV